MWAKFTTQPGEKYRWDGEGRTGNHMDTRQWLQKGQKRFTRRGFHYPLTYKKQPECLLKTEGPQFHYSEDGSHISSLWVCCYCL